MIKLFLLTSLLILSTGCSNKLNCHYVLFDYSDFGPQAMSNEIIGYEWWQWDSHGHPSPDTEYDVKVVVYRDIALETVQRKFPISKKEKKDFRYLEFRTAVDYLNKNSSELGNSEITKQLKCTLNLIESKL